jgi:hypothetical protein
MQIFSRSLNRLPLQIAVALLAIGGGVVFVFWYYFSPKNLQVGYTPRQPVEYSHKLHAGQLGIDCRYCHANVETAAHAMVPPTQTCMGCHTLVKPDSVKLAKVRESWQTGKPIEWVKVHRLPDHAFFNHSAHVSAGVGCVSCHGRVDQMEEVQMVEPLSMGWCLDCHRNPEPHLRPKDRVTDMQWKPSAADKVALARPVLPPEHCTGCHR